MKRSAVARLIGAGGLAIASAGCMTEPIRHVQPDGTYCYRIGRSYRLTLTCTTTVVPSDATEADAKGFVPSAGAATLYIVRKRWADTQHRVPVSVNGSTVQTIPNSVVRVRAAPGDLEISLTWEGRTELKRVSAQSGDVAFIEIDGSEWFWGARYRLDDSDAIGAKQRAARSKLIADVDLRR